MNATPEKIPVSITPSIVSEKTPVSAIRSVDRDSLISKFLTSGLKKFTPATQVTKKVDTLMSHAQKQQMTAAMAMKPVSIDAQPLQVRKAPVSQIPNLRTDYTIYESRPGLGDNENGNLLMANQESYNDGTPSHAYAESVQFSGSNDFGDSYGNSVYFGDTNNIPLAWEMPSQAYWGMNGTFDRWYNTFRDDTVPGTSTGNIQLGRWETTQSGFGSPADLMNATFEGVEWRFSSQGFSDIRFPQITTDNRFQDWFWGWMSFSIDGQGKDNFAAWATQTAENGSASLGGWLIGGVQGTDASIDAVGNHRVIVWDPLDTTYGPYHGFLIDWGNTTNPADPTDEAWLWTDTHYAYNYPAVKMYNHEIVMALQSKNMTGSHPNELEIVKFVNDSTGVDPAADTGWTWNGGQLMYPEVAHVQGRTFIVTCIAQNDTNPDDVSVLMTVSYDGGMTWSDLYTYSGDDIVIPEYRAVEMPIGGSTLLWEYIGTSANPNDELQLLHYDFLTTQLKGTVYMPQPEHDLAAPTSVVVENTNATYGHLVPGVKIVGSNYFIKLLLGFDAWTDAAIKVTASQTGFSGYSTMTFGYPIPHVNILDVTYNAPPNPPSNPDPSNGAINVPINKVLGWTCTDPDPLDTLSYDVYFGTSLTPPKVSTHQSGTTYNPGTLAQTTLYHWKIVAFDNHEASTAGSLWSFTTITSKPPAPSQVNDTTAWHIYPGDLYKGIGGYPGKYTGLSYTYRSTSTEPGSDLYFTFSWGDTTSTVVGPVSGAASASHIYAIYNYTGYSITVTVKHTPTGTESDPSVARNVRMFKTGDINLDGRVTFADIDPFVAALSGHATWPSNLYWFTADCNWNYAVSFADIDPFVARIGD